MTQTSPLTVGAGPSVVTWGSAVTYSAAVTGAAGGSPSGQVAFGTGPTTLCDAPVVNGTASCTANNTPVGTNEVVIGTYSGVLARGLRRGHLQLRRRRLLRLDRGHDPQQADR